MPSIVVLLDIFPVHLAVVLKVDDLVLGVGRFGSGLSGPVAGLCLGLDHSWFLSGFRLGLDHSWLSSGFRFGLDLSRFLPGLSLGLLPGHLRPDSLEDPLHAFAGCVADQLGQLPVAPARFTPGDAVVLDVDPDVTVPVLSLKLVS